MTRGAKSSSPAEPRPERSFRLRRATSTVAGLRGTLAEQRRAFDSLLDHSIGASEDPVFFGHRHADPGDREIAATVAALFAYGRVDVMSRVIDAILERLGPSPRAALLAGEHRRRGWGRDLRYRFQRSADVVALLEALGDSVARWGGLGAALAHHAHPEGMDGDEWAARDPEAGLAPWVATLRGAAGRDTVGLRHLLADPSGGGAVKRWRLLLRWMIRPADGVDLGLWSRWFSAGELILPVDTHWIRIGARLGLTSRKTPDTRMARELTAGLRRLHPTDPLRYDLPVCHLGISGACPPRLEPHHCAACPLRTVCRSSLRPGAGARRSRA